MTSYTSYIVVIILIVLSLDILVQVQKVLDIMTIRHCGLDLVERPQGWNPQNPTILGGNDITILSHHLYILYLFANYAHLKTLYMYMNNQ